MEHAQPPAAPAATAAILPAAAVANPSLHGMYSPPAIIFRARLEATAAFCDDGFSGKSDPICQGPINS